jgi:heptosyltransferase-2
LEVDLPDQSFSSNFDPRSLLVRSVNWLGDAVMTTPALQRLRERFPRTQISLLTHQKLGELWQHHPCVDSVLAFSPGDNPWAISRELRRHHFDAALILPNSVRSALEVWLAGIPRRVGYRAGWRDWLLTESTQNPYRRSRPRKRRVSEVKRLISATSTAHVSRSREAIVHQIHDYLDLAKMFGCNPDPLPPRLEVNSEELESAAAHLGQLLPSIKTSRGSRSPIWLGLNVSSAYGPAKCWPADRFAAVVREISTRHPGCVWLSFGAQSDEHLSKQVASASAGSVINLAGKTSLRELMALLKTCRLLLGNDSGPMHVAAALGTPVVVPFGSTSAELTGPGTPGDPKHQLLRGSAVCAPCFLRTCPIDFRCMNSITVDQVVAATLRILRPSIEGR